MLNVLSPYPTAFSDEIFWDTMTLAMNNDCMAMPTQKVKYKRYMFDDGYKEYFQANIKLAMYNTIEKSLLYANKLDIKTRIIMFMKCLVRKTMKYQNLTSMFFNYSLTAFISYGFLSYGSESTYWRNFSSILLIFSLSITLFLFNVSKMLILYFLPVIFYVIEM